MQFSQVSSLTAFNALLPTLSSLPKSSSSNIYAISARSSSTITFRTSSTNRYRVNGTIPEIKPQLSAANGNGHGGGAARFGNQWHDNGDDDHGDWQQLFTAPLAMWRRYNTALKIAPLRTKSISAAILGALSDLLAQSITPSSTFDLSRVLRAIAAGLLLTGPGAHFWFQKLDSLIIGTTSSSVIFKVFIDQILYAPLITCVFLAFMRLTEGRSNKETFHFIHTNLPKTMIDSYKLWPVANLINFAYVPSAHRVAFVSIISVFWNSYLSTIANSQS